VVGTGLLGDVSTLCAVVPPAELCGVVGTGLLWDVSRPCALVPPAGLCGVWFLLVGGHGVYIHIPNGGLIGTPFAEITFLHRTGSN
jgi:hypothetical protein